MVDTSMVEDTDGNKSDFVDFLENITPLGSSPQSDVEDGADEGHNSILDSVDAAAGTAAVDTPVQPLPLTGQEDESMRSVFAASSPLMHDMEAEAEVKEEAKEEDEEKEVEVQVEMAPVVEIPAPSVFARLEEVCAAAPPSQEQTLLLAASSSSSSSSSYAVSILAPLPQSQAAATNVVPTVVAQTGLLRLALETPPSAQTRAEEAAEEADSDAQALARLQVRQQLAQWKFHWERVSRKAAQLAQRRLLQLTHQ